MAEGVRICVGAKDGEQGASFCVMTVVCNLFHLLCWLASFGVPVLKCVESTW